MLYIINIASVWERHMSVSSYGFIIYDDHKRRIFSATGLLENVTQQIIEYYSIMFGLQTCLDRGIDDILVLLENRTLVCRLSGFGIVQQGLLKLLYNKVMSLVGKFRHVTFQHVHAFNNRPTRELATSPLLIEPE